MQRAPERDCSPLMKKMEIENIEDSDIPHPHTLALSQTCWEYQYIVDRENRNPPTAGLQVYYPDCKTRGDNTFSPREQIAKKREEEKEAREGKSEHEIERGEEGGESRIVTKKRYHEHQQHQPDRSPDSGCLKRFKSGDGFVPHCPSALETVDYTTEVSPTTTLETLRTEVKEGTQHGKTCSSVWNIFILILQNSGLQRISSRGGYDLNVTTLLVADPSSSFLRVILWRRAAQFSAKLIRAGDLVRLNRVSVSSFRGTVQVNSTPNTSFRVVWRNDTFTNTHDIHTMSMLPLGQITRQEGGQSESRRFIHFGDELAVSRESACDLAMWAKREFPSVVAPIACTVSVGSNVAQTKSLAAIRRGVETTVHACVVDVSNVEHMWSWGSSEGQVRKDLISRAVAVLTDGSGRRVMLQLWGELASEENVCKLRVEADYWVMRETSPEARTVGKLAVFVFTRLRPEFSQSCEALVLNTTNSSEIRKLDAKCTMAHAVVGSVENCKSEVCPSQGCEATAWSGATDPTLTRTFTSIDELTEEETFFGVANLPCVVVRKVETLRVLAEASTTDLHGEQAISKAPSSHGAVILYLGDPYHEDMQSIRGGVEATIRVVVGGGALSNLLGGIPHELLTLSLGDEKSCERVDGVHTAVGSVIRSLLDGLEEGGRAGEHLSVDLACITSADDNGKVLRGGISYRLIRLSQPPSSTAI